MATTAAVKCWTRDESEFWKGGDPGQEGLKRSDVTWLLRSLSREQLNHFLRPAFLNDCRHKFRLLDKDKSGFLEKDELVEAVLHMFPAVQRKLVEKDYCLPGVTADSMDSLIHAFDKDGDGRISEEEFPEFVQFCQAWRIHQYFHASNIPKESIATNRVFNPPRVMTAPSSLSVREGETMDMPAAPALLPLKQPQVQHSDSRSLSKVTSGQLQDLQPLRASTAPGGARKGGPSDQRMSITFVPNATLMTPTSGGLGLGRKDGGRLSSAGGTVTVRIASPGNAKISGSASAPRLDGIKEKVQPAARLTTSSSAAELPPPGDSRPRSSSKQRPAAPKAPNFQAMTEDEYEEEQTKALALWVEANADKCSLRQLVDEKAFFQSILRELQAPTMGKAFTPEIVKRTVDDTLGDFVEDEVEVDSEHGGASHSLATFLGTGSTGLSRLSPSAREPADRPQTAQGSSTRKRSAGNDDRGRDGDKPAASRRHLQALALAADMQEEEQLNGSVSAWEAPSFDSTKRSASPESSKQNESFNGTGSEELGEERLSNPRRMQISHSVGPQERHRSADAPQETRPVSSAVPRRRSAEAKPRQSQQQQSGFDGIPFKPKPSPAPGSRKGSKNSSAGQAKPHKDTSGLVKQIVSVLRELERHSPMTYSDMVGQILWRHRAQEPLKSTPLHYLVEDIRWVAAESKVRDDVERTFRSLTAGEGGRMRYQEWQTVVNFMRLNPVLHDSISVGITSRIFYSATQHRMPPTVSFKEFLELLLEMGEMIQVHPAFLFLSVAANAPQRQ